MKRRGPIIAIDGAAGSGKSTLGRGLASALDLPYVNTGAMYRALTARVLADGVDLDDVAEIDARLASMHFSLSDQQPQELFIDGEPPGPELTTPEVEGAVSAVSRHPTVRQRMAEMQRALGEGGAVMEGRDIATVIFPDAEVKLYLQADPSVRAERRAAERQGAVDAHAAQVRDRDARDARTTPLEATPGADVIDTGGADAPTVLQMALDVVAERLG